MATFTPSGSGGAPLNIVVTGASNPTITNVSLAIANTEVGISLPSGCKQFLIKLRDGMNKLQLSYSPGTSGSTYLTIPPGVCYTEGELSTNTTIYVQSPVASQIVELVTWV